MSGVWQAGGMSTAPTPTKPVCCGAGLPACPKAGEPQTLAGAFCPESGRYWRKRKG